MKKYKFSMPMPAQAKYIEKIVAINQELKKSVIDNFYFSLPLNCVDNTGFEQHRVLKDKMEKFEDYVEVISKAKDFGFDIIYLLNSPKPFWYESLFLQKQFEKLDRLIKNLKKLGVTKFRVSNIQLINYLRKNYPDISIYASTTLEYHTLKQYSNFLEIFNEVKEVVPSTDVNKNFKLLKNLRKNYPGISIELIVNEGCMYSCPMRSAHPNDFVTCITKCLKENRDLYNVPFIDLCFGYRMKDPLFELCSSKNIYPWEIDEYGELGITKFKLVGRPDFFSDDENIVEQALDNIKKYLLGVDNYENIKNEPIKRFNYYYRLLDVDYTVEQIKDYLPNINHFKKYGHYCSSECGEECNYCRECAEKIKNI